MIHPMLQKGPLAPEDNMPSHWERLNQQDLQNYLEIRQFFYKETKKSAKGERLDVFAVNIKRIKQYIDNGVKEDKWKRNIVCGIVFLQNSLAINIQQLRTLLGKCKSSINGSLQQLGYAALPQGMQNDKELLETIPFLASERGEAKKWTIRENTSERNIFVNAVHPPTLDELLSRPRAKLVMPIIQQTKNSSNIGNLVHNLFPCPIKFRSKFYDSIHHTVALQTEV